jgi:hypothetical protein
MTGAELKTKDLFPNHTVRGLIRTWQEAQWCPPEGPAARCALEGQEATRLAREN